VSEALGNPVTTMIFVVDEDAAERERMTSVLSAAGYAVVPMEGLDKAESLIAHNAACDVLLLSAEALADHESRFDAILDKMEKKPKVIICGSDRGGKLASYCLNLGATDFLARPLTDDEILESVNQAIADGLSGEDADRDSIIASSPVSGWIELTSTSELDQLRRLQRFSDALFASSLPASVCEDLKMAVEEVGRNAMEWGNQFDPDKKVSLSYCMFDDRIVIKCQDEGEGFKRESVPDPTADPVKTMQLRQEAGKRPGGYGVYLIQKLVDEVVYNEKGNSVLMIKYLPDRPTRIFLASNGTTPNA